MIKKEQAKSYFHNLMLLTELEEIFSQQKKLSFQEYVNHEVVHAVDPEKQLYFYRSSFISNNDLTFKPSNPAEITISSNADFSFQLTKCLEISSRVEIKNIDVEKIEYLNGRNQFMNRFLREIKLGQCVFHMIDIFYFINQPGKNIILQESNLNPEFIKFYRGENIKIGDDISNLKAEIHPKYPYFEKILMQIK